MKNKNNMKVGMIALAAVLLLGVGFAAFTTVLNISGTASLTGDFEVIFNSASITPTPAEQSDEAATITDDGQTLTWKISLAKPGDSKVVNYQITNNGSIDATLNELSITAGADDPDVTITPSVIAGDLASQGTKDGTITVTLDSDSVAAKKDITFTATINATQK